MRIAYCSEGHNLRKWNRGSKGENLLTFFYKLLKNNQFSLLTSS